MREIWSKLKELKNAIKVGWFLAFRQVRHSGKGTTILIISIMVLTFLNLVVVSGLMVGLISGSFRQYREGYSGEVIITSADGRSYIENSPALISYLENHPDVQAISPRHTVGSQILGTLNDLPNKNERANSIGIRLVGIDPAKEEILTHFSRFVKYGENLNEEEEGYILIGSNFIKKYSSFADANIAGYDMLEDVDIGSRVRVSFARQDGEVVAKDFIIKGFLKSKVDEISIRAFITDKELKRMLPVNKEQYQEIAVKINYDLAPGLVAELKSFMGTNAARIQTADEAIPTFLRDMESTIGMIGNVLSSIALLVASISIFVVIFINAVTKRKFIGIMKGIGISPQAIQFSYIFQAFFFGLVGSVIGLILTFGILKPYFDAHPIDFAFSDGILVATFGGSILRLLVLLVVTLIAGYLPAKLIIRKNTLDAILGR